MMAINVETSEKSIRREMASIPRRRSRVVVPHITDSYKTRKITERNKKIIDSLKKS